MEWEFTPQEVVKGRIGHSLADFRQGLAEEVRQNVAGDAGVFTRSFHLRYDLCHALATSKDLEAHPRPTPAIRRRCSSCASWRRS